jgi:hypothetical protein
MGDKDSKLIFEAYNKNVINEALVAAPVVAAGGGAISLINMIMSLGASLGITWLAGKQFADLINLLQPKQLSELEVYASLAKNVDDAFKSQDLDRIKTTVDEALIKIYDLDIPALNDIASVLMKGTNAFYKSYVDDGLEETGEEAMGVLAASIEASATALISFANSTIQIIQNSNAPENIKTSTITAAQQATKSLDDIVVNAKSVRQQTKRKPKPKTQPKPKPRPQKPKGPKKDWIGIIGRILRGSVDIVNRFFGNWKTLLGIFIAAVLCGTVIPVIYMARNGVGGLNDLITGMRNIPSKATSLFNSLNPWGDDESGTQQQQTADDGAGLLQSFTN